MENPLLLLEAVGKDSVVWEDPVTDITIHKSSNAFVIDLESKERKVLQNPALYSSETKQIYTTAEVKAWINAPKDKRESLILRNPPSETDANLIALRDRFVERDARSMNPSIVEGMINSVIQNSYLTWTVCWLVEFNPDSPDQREGEVIVIRDEWNPERESEPAPETKARDTFHFIQWETKSSSSSASSSQITGSWVSAYKIVDLYTKDNYRCMCSCIKSSWLCMCCLCARYDVCRDSQDFIFHIVVLFLFFFFLLRFII